MQDIFVHLRIQNFETRYLCVPDNSTTLSFRVGLGNYSRCTVSWFLIIGCYSLYCSWEVINDTTITNNKKNIIEITKIGICILRYSLPVLLLSGNCNTNILYSLILLQFVTRSNYTICALFVIVLRIDTIL